MRGVHPETEGLAVMFQGSSPHARGPPIEIRFNHDQIRIIPACAGSTEVASQVFPWT